MLADNTFYMMDTFCIGDDYLYLGADQAHATNCTEFEEPWNLSEFEILKLDPNITSQPILINFIPDVASSINSYESGYAKLNQTTFDIEQMVSMDKCHEMPIGAKAYPIPKLFSSAV